MKRNDLLRSFTVIVILDFLAIKKIARFISDVDSIMLRFSSLDSLDCKQTCISYDFLFLDFSKVEESELWSILWKNPIYEKDVTLYSTIMNPSQGH